MVLDIAAHFCKIVGFFASHSVLFWYENTNIPDFNAEVIYVRARRNVCKKRSSKYQFCRYLCRHIDGYNGTLRVVGRVHGA